MTWFVFLSAASIFAFAGIDKTNIYRSLVVAGGVFLVALPWLARIAAIDGVRYYVNAFSSEGIWWPNLVHIVFPLFTNEPYLSILAVLGILGILVAIRDNEPFSVIWLVTIFVFQKRFSVITATVPFAMLVGMGVDRIIMLGTGISEILD